MFEVYVFINEFLLPQQSLMSHAYLIGSFILENKLLLNFLYSFYNGKFSLLSGWNGLFFLPLKLIFLNIQHVE